MWDIFMDQMEQLTAYVPWMLTNGNHEIDWPTGADRYSINGNIDSGALSCMASLSLATSVHFCMDNLQQRLQAGSSAMCFSAKGFSPC